ncbi:MAG: hypothetical protein HC841_03400 [Verrucomicrobiae bacterium]|nr:hypothetical protein [Verrucomicrobiae bacterium]
MAPLTPPNPAQPAKTHRARTAFVFAGGGSLGAIQVGMLKALADYGVFPDMVVGTSVGSINAAYLAGRPTLAGVKELEQIWLNLRRGQLFPMTLRSLVRFMRRRDFLLDSAALHALIEQHLPYRRLEQAQIPIHIVTTDLLTGRTIVLARGPAAAAIVAVLVARALSVWVIVSGLNATNVIRADCLGLTKLLTWGGLRGGLSLALAVSLPDSSWKPLILNMTFAVVVFSIVVQGLTIQRMFTKDRLEGLLRT